MIIRDNWSCNRAGVQTIGKPIALDAGKHGTIFILGNSLVSLAQGKKICWHNCFYRIRFVAALKMLIIFYNWLTAQNASAGSGVCSFNRLGNHRRNNDRVWDRVSSAFERRVFHLQFRTQISHLLLSLLQGIWSDIVFLDEMILDLFFLFLFPTPHLSLLVIRWKKTHYREPLSVWWHWPVVFVTTCVRQIPKGSLTRSQT